MLIDSRYDGGLSSTCSCTFATSHNTFVSRLELFAVRRSSKLSKLFVKVSF